jgi:hypothetical protein
MAKKITYTATRPNTDTPWFTWPANISQYTKTHYVDTGKIMERTITISDDQLTMTVVVIWQDGAFEEWSADPITREGRLAQNIYNLETTS